MIIIDRQLDGDDFVDGIYAIQVIRGAATEIEAFDDHLEGVFAKAFERASYGLAESRNDELRNHIWASYDRFHQSRNFETRLLEFRKIRNIEREYGKDVPHDPRSRAIGA